MAKYTKSKPGIKDTPAPPIVPQDDGSVIQGGKVYGAN